MLLTFLVLCLLLILPELPIEFFHRPEHFVPEEVFLVVRRHAASAAAAAGEMSPRAESDDSGHDVSEREQKCSNRVQLDLELQILASDPSGYTKCLQRPRLSQSWMVQYRYRRLNIVKLGKN